MSYSLVKLYELLQSPSRNGLTKQKAIRGSGVKMIAMGEIFANSILDTRINMDRVPINEKELKNYSIQPQDILFARQSLVLDGAGKCVIVKNIVEQTVFESHLIRIRINQKKANPYFIYYLFNSSLGKNKIRSITEQVAAAGIRGSDLIKLEIPCPELNIQNKIAAILIALDEKIFLNKQINDNLQQQVIALFHQIFDECNHNRKNIRAEEYFDISIGKTPPRKEHQWFSKNSSDCVWVSISDMGSSGLYIENSSEYLTLEAIKKFNIKIVPDNTVILSFKLTVGRVAIADGWMTTNEAIAHFKTDKPEITEYLYCYLKCFNFQTMGSTSSIATAVNSKIIKDMPFIVPTDDELEKFHNIAMPLFMIIKSNQRENKRLTELRDTLLPKLLSGELDVSELDI